MDRHGISTGNGTPKDFLTPAQRPSAEALEPRLLLSGTSYLVNSLADAVATDGVVTLREAIQAANTNLARNEAPAGSAAEADIITFDQAALSTEAGVAVGEPVTITLSGSQLEITDSVAIQGLGADVLAVDADGQSRVLYVSGADTEVDLTDLTITGGGATATQAAGSTTMAAH